MSVFFDKNIIKSTQALSIICNKISLQFSLYQAPLKSLGLFSPEKRVYKKLRCISTVKIRFGRKKILIYAYMLKNGVGRYNIFLFIFTQSLLNPYVCALLFMHVCPYACSVIYMYVGFKSSSELMLYVFILRL
jgi:hypothetical protein